jgi:hypothetical protein
MIRELYKDVCVKTELQVVLQLAPRELVPPNDAST